MAGLYEQSSALELLDSAYGYQAEYEPTKHKAFWRGQSRLATPFSAEMAAIHWQPTANEAAETVSLPPSRGGDVRYHVNERGHWYTGCSVEPEEIPEREQRFKEFTVPILKDPLEWWEQYKKQLDELWKPVKEFALDVENKKDVEVSIFLNEDYWVRMKKAYRIHYIVMYPLASFYIALESMTKELVGIEDNDVRFKKMFQGFNNRSYETDRQLWKLAQRAEELGLQEIIASTTQEEMGELPSILEQTEAGKQFVTEFRKFLREYGWRNETFDDCSEPGWIDDPAMPLAHIKEHLGEPVFRLDEISPQLIKEREQIVEEISSQLPQEQKGIWLALLRGSQVFQVFGEEHPLYIEMPSVTTHYRIIREVGKRWERKGTIEHWRDIFHLSAFEVFNHIIIYRDLDYRKLVERRKKLWEENNRKAADEPNYWGDPTQAEVDPVLRKVSGYGTTVRVTAGAIAAGIPGAPGIAEGVARIISSPKECNQIKDGDILVCEMTTSAWLPIFSNIKGVVSDWGGSLCHAAIVAREYGIPAVVSCKDATRRIKNGHGIRVNGNKGLVYAVD